MILIGLTGKAGAGKDTVADYLVAKHRYEKLSMAGPLKAGLAAMGLPEPSNRDDKELVIPGLGFSWRQAAQRLGTEWGRGLDEDLWLKLMERQLSRHPSNCHYFVGERRWPVISDIRFNNEAEMLRSRGGVIIHIGGRQADLGSNAAHASEAGVLLYPNVDEVIINDGTLDQLYAKIDAIMEQYV